jgi:MYXO-CTERM domain-containing protein
MPSLRLAFSTLAISVLTAWSSAALADVAPPDACNLNMVGMPCNNAGPNGNQAGTCQNAMCPHTGPGPDGGLVTTYNPCTLCEPEGSGTGGSSSSGTPGGGGGCAVGPAGREGILAGAMVLAGVGALFAGRRRRRG